MLPVRNCQCSCQEWTWRGAQLCYRRRTSCANTRIRLRLGLTAGLSLGLGLGLEECGVGTRTGAGDATTGHSTTTGDTSVLSRGRGNHRDTRSCSASVRGWEDPGPCFSKSSLLPYNTFVLHTLLCSLSLTQSKLIHYNTYNRFGYLLYV